MREDGIERNLENGLSRLRQEIAGVESVQSFVRDRLAVATMRTSTRKAWWIAAAACVLVGLMAAWHGGLFRGGTDSDPRIGGSAPAAQAECRLGDVMVAEHLVLVVDPKAVLVVWSWKGDRHTASGAARSRTRYDEYVFERKRTQDGRVVLWSLFVARGDVRPALNPPAVRLEAPDGRFLVFGTSPSHATRDGIDAAIRTVAESVDSRMTLDDVERLLRRKRRTSG